MTKFMIIQIHLYSLVSEKEQRRQEKPIFEYDDYAKVDEYIGL